MGHNLVRVCLLVGYANIEHYHWEGSIYELEQHIIVPLHKMTTWPTLKISSLTCELCN